MASLIDTLCLLGPSFNFFQAVELLEEKFRDEEGVLDAADKGRIRFSGTRSLGFPAGDIESIRQRGDTIECCCTFMGLSGVSSPLPMYFSEYICRYPENGDVLFDFLSLFNHRMYALFHRAWKKNLFLRNVVPGRRGDVTPFIRALCGITGNGQKSASLMAACAGLFAGHIRSAAGCAALLSYSFGDLPVRIREWLPRRVSIPQPPQLGKTIQLGNNAVCGTEVLDVAGAFRVILGPLKREVYQTFLPGSSHITVVKELIQNYCADPLAFEIEVQLQSEELIPVVLGEEVARLGETSSLGVGTGNSTVQSILIPAE